jgi:phosphatidate cytidylyltransferase
MAFSWNSFKTRALTALLFLVVMLGCLWWNAWSFLLLFSIIHFGCWFEYQRLVAAIDPGYRQITPFHRYGAMLAGWCLLLWFSGPSFRLGGLLLHEAGWWLGLVCAFVLPITELLFNNNIRPKNIAHSFFGLVYISLSMGLMMDLQAKSSFVVDAGEGQPHFTIASIFPLVIIYSIWINDTMAYIVGSLIGKTPLSTISPKKTWEGTLGGIILSIAVTGLLSVYVFRLDRYLDRIHWFIIPGIAAIAGTFGDLLESRLKRLAGVKDSGAFMPGHGGFLDRFDSLLVATLFVWIYVRIVLAVYFRS